jgi:hypothetical protein
MLSESAVARRALDGADDSRIGATTADIAVHVLDDLLASRVWIRFEKRCCLHDLSRLAIATLRHLLRNPRSLQRMRGVGRKTFDGGHMMTDHGTDRGNARSYGLTVQVHGAGSTQRDATAVFRAGQLQLIAQPP